MSSAALCGLCSGLPQHLCMEEGGFMSHSFHAFLNFLVMTAFLMFFCVGLELQLPMILKEEIVMRHPLDVFCYSSGPSVLG